jgi:AraC-like DNA-binding protein
MTLVLDQPDLIAPSNARRMGFDDAPAISILNARGARFDGGGDEPELSLKWIPRGRALYRSEGRSFALTGGVQLLLNRGQSYRIAMREESESFVVFFGRAVADAAWQARTGKAGSFGEVPAVAGASPPALQAALQLLRAEARREAPSGALLAELALALLENVVALALERRQAVQRIPAVRSATRDELLRRLARAETCLIDSGAQATLDAVARAAALSPFHLIRVFRAVHGETPLAWAAGMRLEQARDALRLTDDAIAEIARRAGYESRTAFDRAFRRRFGDTPGSVRRAR